MEMHGCMKEGKDLKVQSEKEGKDRDEDGSDGKEQGKKEFKRVNEKEFNSEKDGGRADSRERGNMLIKMLIKIPSPRIPKYRH